MAFLLYDFVDSNGENVFKQWSLSLQKAERAKLNQKLDALEKHGDVLFPQMLTNTDTAGILKLRVKGQKQLRPMLCKGPVDVNGEFTLLLGAIEKDWKLIPKDADKLADKNRKKVKKEPSKYRVNHERVG